VTGARRRRTLGLVLGFLVACAGSFGWRPPGAGLPGGPLSAPPAAGQADPTVALGEHLFSAGFTPEDGLGPLFNAPSCASCHSVPEVGGMGPEGLGVAIRVGRTVDGRFDPIEEQGGPVARRHSHSEDSATCAVRPGIPAGATITSVRNAPSLFGLGLLGTIPDEAILAGAVPRGDGVHGRPHLVTGAAGAQRVGRFGWKADSAALEGFVAEAFRNEHGITSPLAPRDFLPVGSDACPASDTGVEGTSVEGTSVEDDGTMVRAVTSFVAALPPLAPGPAPDQSLVTRGAALFRAAGCVACHTPSLPGSLGEVPLYSDLLLHDLGPALDDGVVQGDAGGRDWRTTPLWGLGARPRFLHDGRARTVRAAIQAHGGEADAAAARFRALAEAEREALLAFLDSL
jgi:CxxC motif-containing protein (DUF1111 family)